MSNAPPPAPPAAVTACPSNAPDADAALVAALARSRVMVEAPEAVILRAVDVFVARPRPAAAPSAEAQPLRRLATLVLDSFALPAQALGLRGDGAAERKLLFGAEGRDVDLRIAPGLAGWQLRGQVLGPDAAGFVELQCGDFTTHAAWNAQSEFHLENLPAGDWQLVLRSADWVLSLPSVRVPGEGG